MLENIPKMLGKFLEILEKIGEMQGKFPKNSGKYSENAQKIPDNSGKNWGNSGQCHSHTCDICHTYEICHNKCQQPISEVWKISHEYKKFPTNTKIFPRYDLYIIGCPFGSRFQIWIPHLDSFPS